MLKVTDNAAALIGARLEAGRHDAHEIVRVSRTGQDFGLGIGHERDQDVVIMQGETKVLVLDPEIASMLENATIDAVDSPDGEQLVLSMGDEAA